LEEISLKHLHEKKLSVVFPDLLQFLKTLLSNISTNNKNLVEATAMTLEDGIEAMETFVTGVHALKNQN
jgi:hypothetical protein